jgi:hypothetical protein
MTTSHAPVTIPRTTIELIGRAITTISATALGIPVKMCQPRSEVDRQDGLNKRCIAA